MTNRKHSKDRSIVPIAPEVKRWETVNRLRRIDLPMGQHCLVMVQPVGLNDPNHGTSVSVKCTLFLPCSGDPNYIQKIIPKELRFGNNIGVFGSALWDTWGTQSVLPEYRSKDNKESGRNWQEAFSIAESYLKSEVGKLRDALQARHDALHSEGYEMLVAARLMGDELPPIEPMDWSSWAGIEPSEPSEDDVDDPFVDA